MIIRNASWCSLVIPDPAGWQPIHLETTPAVGTLPLAVPSPSKEPDPMPDKPSLDRILERLRSGDEKVREVTKGDLFRLRHRAAALTTDEGLRALRAASQGFPFDRPDPDELAEYLVDVAAKRPRPEYIPVVVSSFEKLGDKAKWWALVILAQLEDRLAAEAYMEILRAHAGAGRVPRLVIGPLERKPRHADVFFPELFHHAQAPALAADVYGLCLAYCRANLLPAETLEPHTGQVLATYRGLEERLRPAQRPDGVAWMWEETYSGKRFESGLLLDLLGYFPSGRTEAELRRALEFRDPRLRYFAIASLLRQGEPVDPETIAGTYAHPEVRMWLHDELQGRGMSSVVPERYRTQAALAESDMVQWLTYPTDMSSKARICEHDGAGRDATRTRRCPASSMKKLRPEKSREP
jgi:hypothetical protein